VGVPSNIINKKNKMKKIYYFALFAFEVLAFSACQKEVSNPVVSEVTFSVGVGVDSVVKEGIAGIPLKITVITDANICTIWPAGIRDTLKSELNPAVDSVDVRGTVFTQCDDYSLYQTKILTGVHGYNMNNLLNLTGFTYVYGNDDDIAGYTKPGSYDIAFVLTKDGENGKSKSVIIRKTLTVK
jgi:hypothetical protein